MSYILEALADSEQARRQLAAAPTYSLLPVLGENLQPRRVWPYALAGTLLVNLAVLQLWLRPVLPGNLASSAQPTAQPLAQVAVTAPLPPAVQTPAAVSAPLAAAIPVAAAEWQAAPVARSAEPTAAVADATLRRATPAPPRPERANDGRIARASTPAGAIARTATSNPANESASLQIPRLAPGLKAKPGTELALAAGAAPKAAAIVATRNQSSPKSAGDSELSPALQKELPALSVAGFIRGEGSASMVIVNDRLVREGDEVAPGVKLENIRSDGLVLSYKGYRFKR